jgi:hypothetical protein
MILITSASFGQIESFGTNSPIILNTIRKAPYIIYKGNNTEMKVLWQLTITDTCTLVWGTDTLYGLGNTVTTEYGNSHQHAYTITNLIPSAKYYYRVTVNGEIYIGSFRSAPDTNETNIKFMVYGDTRSNPASHDQVAAAMVTEFNEDENFQSIVLSVGDLVNNGNSESDWDNQFFNPSYPNIKTLLANAPYQAAMGNHEGTGQLFGKYFPYPFVAGRYWSFDYGPVHFVIVDQYTSYGPGSAQLTWIENDLASTTKSWKFICFHEPGWSAGGHGNSTSVQNYIQPLCEQYGVSIVFAGHNHYYARAVVNEIQHITTGGGGAPLYSPNSTYPNVVATAMAYHFCNIEIDGSSLHFTALKPDSTIIDEFTINVTDIESSSTPVILDEYILYPAYPNPFNPATTIEFAIPNSEFVTLKVYNILGEEVATLVSERLAAGSYKYQWDANSLASGVYFYRIETAEFAKSRKMILLR